MWSQLTDALSRLLHDLHQQSMVHESGRPQSEAGVVLLVTAATLAAIHSLVGNHVYQLYASRIWPERFLELGLHIHWAFVTIMGYVLPAALVMAWYRVGPEAVGLSPRGAVEHAWLYVAMLLIMLPIVWMASQRDDFACYYPFHRGASRGGVDLWGWEIAYSLQFLTLEFFFRGFLLFMLARSVGIYAVPIMTVPYCMIHFGKPTLEIYASIIAGLVLGVTALATRSIWLGAGLHLAVAWTMDWLALRRTVAGD